MADATPGPWLITGVMSGHRGDIYSPTAKRIPDCHHIARCFAPMPEGAPACDLQVIQMTNEAIAQIEANARLIAAAPELLEALLPIEGLFREFVGKVDEAWFDRFAKVQFEARAAIAKALGTKDAQHGTD